MHKAYCSYMAASGVASAGGVFDIALEGMSQGQDYCI